MTHQDKSTGVHTLGQLVLEDKTQSGAGLQIMGVIGEPVSRREFVEFRLKGDKPIPLFLVAYDQWMQFPNPEWKEMQKANARRIVACWNACIGIETVSLEAGGSGWIQQATHSAYAQRDALIKQNTALAEALKGIREHCPCDPDVTDEFYKAWQAMLAALSLTGADR